MPKLAVLALVPVTVGIGWLVLGSYRQSFDDWAQVTVITGRAGLVMDRGAKVTMAGVEVGEVTAIDYRPDRARLTLRLHRSALASIPADVTARITSDTVFGAKFVSLTAPATSAAARLTPGAVLDASHVTVEINTVFEQLVSVLGVIDPAQLQATLGALATALQGRGDRLGTALDHAADVLTQLNSSGITDLLRTAAPATGLYADITPDLLHTLDALTTTGRTVTDDQQQLSNLLESATILSNTGSNLLDRNGSGITDALRPWAPTSALAALYAPDIPCVFEGIAQGNRNNPAAYGAQPGVKMFAGFVPGVTPYRYPQDLPKIDATGGPHCLGLPRTDPVVNVPYVVTDIGVNPLAPSRQGIGLRPPNVIDYLFGLGGGR